MIYILSSLPSLSHTLSDSKRWVLWASMMRNDECLQMGIFPYSRYSVVGSHPSGLLPWAHLRTEIKDRVCRDSIPNFPKVGSKQGKCFQLGHWTSRGTKLSFHLEREREGGWLSTNNVPNCYTSLNNYRRNNLDFFPYAFFLTGGKLLYNVVLVSATQQRESAINTHMSPVVHSPPHPTPLGCHRALGWAPCVT